MVTVGTRDVVAVERRVVARLAQHDFGVVIGVDHYPRFRPLQGALRDARAFHAWLCDPAGGGVAAERTRLLLSTPEPAAPLQDEIDDALADILNHAERVQGGRRLYFYFSGHGAGNLAAVDDVALLLAKWSQALARMALSLAAYASTLVSVGAFDEVVMFLDCCRNVSTRAVGLPPYLSGEPWSNAALTRTFVAYATEARQSAFEVADADGAHGVFTECLLAGLRGGAGAMVTAPALKAFLEREVPRFAAARGVMQRAHVANGLVDQSAFGRASLPRLVVHFTEASGRAALLDGNRAEIHAGRRADGSWDLALAPGLYKLVDPDTGVGVMIDLGYEDGGTHVRF